MNQWVWGAVIWAFTILFLCLTLYAANKDEQP